MAFTDEEVREFKIEAEDLLDQAEKSLLILEKGGSFKEQYDSIFRTFHSIKGAAGMMEMFDLQRHMHELENILTEQKAQPVLSKDYLDLFLRGNDGARVLLEGNSIDFVYQITQPAAAAPLVETPPVPQAKTNAQGKLLVVDDEPELVALLVQMLSDAGFEVKGCTRPEEVMDLIKNDKPNAVLTDISMPNLNGLQLLALITAEDPDIPVIFISGNVTKDSLVEAIRMGVFGVIEKPFHVGRVIEAAHQAVNRHVLTKLVNEGINLLMYQFSDLNQYLKSVGKEDVRNLISTEIKNLVDQRRKMRELRRPKKVA